MNNHRLMINPLYAYIAFENFKYKIVYIELILWTLRVTYIYICNSGIYLIDLYIVHYSIIYLFGFQVYL
jgi:hypothetical protein